MRQTTDYSDGAPKDKPQYEKLDLGRPFVAQKRDRSIPRIEDHKQTALRARVEDKIKSRVIVTTPGPSWSSGANIIDCRTEAE